MVNVNEPVENPKLVDAINTLITESNNLNENVFISELENAHFLTPMRFDGKIENGVVKKNSTMSLHLITDKNEKSYFMAFTDWDELRKWNKEYVETLILTYRDLAEMITQDKVNVCGFTINPLGQNIIITNDIVAYFQNKRTQITIEEEEKVLIGEPATYPSDMIESLKKLFEKTKTISSAFLVYIFYENKNQGNLLLIIDSASSREIFPVIGSHAQGFLSEGEYIDIVELDSEFGRKASKDFKPFYKRKKFGLF